MTDYIAGLFVHHIRSHRGECTGRPRSQGGGTQERDGERGLLLLVRVCHCFAVFFTLSDKLKTQIEEQRVSRGVQSEVTDNTHGCLI